MKNESLESLLPKFIESLTQKGRSPSTILAYRADLEQLTAYANGKSKLDPKSITASDLEAFRDFLLSEKYTPKSTSRKLNAVKTFFRYLSDEGIISSDPSRDVEHPKIESEPPKFLSPLEFRSLRDVTRSDIRIGTIVEIILQTGMRISEVANLKTENIKDGNVTIEKYATQPERIIPLNAISKTSLENYLSARPKTDSAYVFVSKNGKPLAVRNIRAAIDRYMQKAEIGKFSVNDLRTTFIVENIKRGVDLVTLSRVAGHKRLSTTERYLSLAGVKESGKKQKLEEL